MNSPPPRLRLRRVWEKAAYVVGYYMLSFVLGNVVLRGLPDVAVLIAAGAADIAAFAFGTRVFRGRFEAVDPPRAWWRATARPAAGFLIAALLLLSSLILIVSGDPNAYDGGLGALYLVISAFYLRSSVRLARGQGGPEGPDDTRRGPHFGVPFRFG